MTNSRREQLWDLIHESLRILKSQDRTMKQHDLEFLTATQTGISISEMSYVIQNAISEGLIERGELGSWDQLTITQMGRDK